MVCARLSLLFPVLGLGIRVAQRSTERNATNITNITNVTEGELAQRGGSYSKNILVNPSSGMSYLGAVFVGGQEIWGILDTGSFDMVIPGELCGAACRPDRSIPQFNPYKIHRSKGLLAPEMKFKCYGSGCLGVETVQDTVAVSEQDIASSTVGNLSIVVDSSTMDQMSETGGIFGTGLCKLGKDCLTMHRLAGVNRYSICFDTDRSKPGFVVWNDEDRCADDMFTSIPLDTSAGEWATKLSSVSLELNSRSIPLGCGTLEDKDKHCYTVLDSGTSLTSLPHDAVMELVSYFHADSWSKKMTCADRFSDLPDLTFYVGDKKYTMGARSYVWQTDVKVGSGEYRELSKYLVTMPMPMDHRGVEAIHHLHAMETGMFNEVEHDEEMQSPVPVCFLVVDDSSQYYEEPNLAILGMPFFAEYWTTFENAENSEPRICIAHADGDCSNPGSESRLEASRLAAASPTSHITPERAGVGLLPPVSSSPLAADLLVHKVPIDTLLKEFRRGKQRHMSRAKGYRLSRGMDTSAKNGI